MEETLAQRARLEMVAMLAGSQCACWTWTQTLCTRLPMVAWVASRCIQDNLVQEVSAPLAPGLLAAASQMG